MMSQSYSFKAPKMAPTHPGELMREILEDHLKMPLAEAARRMKISRPSLYAALTGKGAVTAEMAIRFARLVGGEPALFVQMQAAYDVWRANTRLKNELKAIRPAA